jgi:hypothetical protein
MDKKIYLRTWGWQMDAVLYDYCHVFKWDLVIPKSKRSND